MKEMLAKIKRYTAKSAATRAILNKARNLFRTRIIIDNARRLGLFSKECRLNTGLNKEEESRKIIFGIAGENLNFLDVGANDGKLQYLLGIRRNLDFSEAEYAKNKKEFFDKFNYYGLDLEPGEASNILTGDICNEDFLRDNRKFLEYFDVIYSNNVFEHFKKPWVAVANIMKMLKAGGICITIAPFSSRYHESPVDCFRYTHAGLLALFEGEGHVVVLVSGYDIHGRRNDWQGSGNANDICPVDKYGAWRENWYVMLAVRKIDRMVVHTGG